MIRNNDCTVIGVELRESDRNKIFREVWEAAIQKVSEEDRKKLNQLAFDLANDKKIRNFGQASAQELITAAAIFMAKYKVRYHGL